MSTTTHPAPEHRTHFRSLGTAGPALLLWALVTSACCALLPDSIWSSVRWVLAAALCVEVIIIVSLRLRHQA